MSYAELGAAFYAAANLSLNDKQDIYGKVANIVYEYLIARGKKGWLVTGIHQWRWSPDRPNVLVEYYAPPLVRLWARVTGRYLDL